jgi:menaquinol-cytochrome c reductase iron-sulfur subunit
MNRTMNNDSEGAREINPGRRRFLNRLIILLAGFGTAVAGIPVLSYVLTTFTHKMPADWHGVGAVENFAVGKTVHVAFKNQGARPWAGATARTGAWLRRTGKQEFVAFALNCTHLGCPVRWEEKARLFMCPCHGGVYYEDGAVAAGPPPLPLQRFTVRIRNGQVQLKNRPITIT